MTSIAASEPAQTMLTMARAFARICVTGEREREREREGGVSHA